MLPKRRSTLLLLGLALSLPALGCPSPSGDAAKTSTPEKAGAPSSSAPKSAPKQGAGDATGAATPSPSSSAAPASTDRRTVGAFAEVHISSSLEADIDIGAQAPLELSGDETALPDVKTEVSGGVLTISLPGSHTLKKPIKVHITIPSLRGIVAESSATLVASGLKSDALEVQASSSANVMLSGTCKKLVAALQSSGHLDAGNLVCEDVEIKAGSSSGATIHATASATGSAESGATVHVKGNPAKKRIEVSSGAIVD